MDCFFVYKDLKRSDALEGYVLKRLGKVEKYLKDDAQVHIVFATKGDEYICSIGIEDKHYFKSVKSKESMYTAIDLCVHSLKNILSKDKDKRKSKWKRNKGIKNSDVIKPDDYVYDYDDCELLHVFDNLD